jgi:hypothetical protein
MNLYILKESSDITGYQGRRYRFKGATGAISWPTDEGAYLGGVGAWNVLWRAGYIPRLLTPASRHVCTPNETLVVVASAPFEPKAKRFISDWIKNGGRLLLSGRPESFNYLFNGQLTVETDRDPSAYKALGYIFENKPCQIIAPPQWSYVRAIRQNALSPVKFHGHLCIISGERQNPVNALITQLDDAPAIISLGSITFFNGNPFAAFQAWLQGQEDLEPWINWRNRAFWFDEYSFYLVDLMRRYNVLHLDLRNPGIQGLGNTTIILRHDLDQSRDTRYALVEGEYNVPGVYAVLNDGNCRFWTNFLHAHPEHEIALHYRTDAASFFRSAITRFIPRFFPSYPQPAHRRIIRKGLYKQIISFHKKGVPVHTLHRHAAYLFYPEFIDALKYTFNQLPQLKGSSSFFRGQILRWGTWHGFSGNPSIAHFPDPQFPFWLPFKLADAAAGGAFVSGWESTSIMEIEPAHLLQLLKYSAHLGCQQVFTLNYHPAHTHSTLFAKNGCIDYFKEILDMLATNQIEVKTLSDVYERCNSSIGGVTID